MIINALKQFILKKQAFLSFLLVGVLTALIYFSLFALLWQFLGLNYQLANTLTYSVAVLFHFFANRRFTFQAHGEALLEHMAKYACMVGLNYLTTVLVMYVDVELWHLTPYLGIVFSTLINIMSNFMLARYWVFRVEA